MKPYFDIGIDTVGVYIKGMFANETKSKVTFQLIMDVSEKPCQEATSQKVKWYNNKV